VTSSDGCEICQDPLFTEKGLDHPQKIAELMSLSRFLTAIGSITGALRYWYFETT